MLLTDGDILAEVTAGHIGIDPFDPGNTQPASLDVQLAPEFLYWSRHEYGVADPRVPDRVPLNAAVISEEKGLVLHPGEFILASTTETVTLPADRAARIEGKSSLGRLGLVLHTAGWIDPGFTGQITLELSNLNTIPIRLWPGMKIGQVCFFRCTRNVTRPYGSPGLGSRYQGQAGPTASRLHPPAGSAKIDA